MKKTLIGLFLVLGATSFANYGKVEVRGGLDLGGKYRYGKNYRDQKTKNTSGEVGVEYRYEVLPGLELGTGRRNITQYLFMELLNIHLIHQQLSDLILKVI